MYAQQRLDIRPADLQTVFEQTVQQHPAAIVLDTLWTATSLEVDLNRVDAMDLLVGVGVAISHRYDQRQQVGVLLGDFREDLNEIERPVLPRELLGVGETVIPGLELIEQQHGGREIGRAHV